MPDTTEHKNPSEVTSWDKAIFNTEAIRAIAYKRFFDKSGELKNLSGKKASEYINSRITKVTARDALNVYGRTQAAGFLYGLIMIPAGAIGLVAGATGVLLSGLANLFVNTEAATNLQKKSQSLISNSLISIESGVGALIFSPIQLALVPIIILGSKIIKGDLDKALHLFASINLLNSSTA